MILKPSKQFLGLRGFELRRIGRMGIAPFKTFSSYWDWSLSKLDCVTLKNVNYNFYVFIRSCMLSFTKKNSLLQAHFRARKAKIQCILHECYLLIVTYYIQYIIITYVGKQLCLTHKRLQSRSRAESKRNKNQSLCRIWLCCTCLYGNESVKYGWGVGPHN